MARVRIRPGARADLLEIWNHIGENSIASADALSDKLDAAIVMLGRQPKAGRLREELGAAVRSSPCGSYILLYREARRGVEILRVLHAARDIESIFEE